MTGDIAKQVDAFVTPGTMLRCARETQGLGQREVEDRLNLMPGYLNLLERDDYQALRAPAFARGYVRAYGRLLGLDEAELLQAFDELRNAASPERKRVQTESLQLQRAGAGVGIGLVVLALLGLGLWLWQGGGMQSLTSAPASIAEDKP